MEDLFKKLIYTGVGLVSTSAEKFQAAIDKLVDDRKLTSEEGKKIVDDFFKNTETKKGEFESQIRSIIEKIVNTVNFASAKEVDELIERVKVLEAHAGIAVPVEETEKKADKKIAAPVKKKDTVSAE
jgi:polyhydroxyalkanoate synthesis regulator phasin